MAYVVAGYWAAGYVASDSEAALSAALQSLAPGAIIELFQLELNAAQHGVAITRYFHAGVNELRGDVVFGGQTYEPLPIEAEGFEWNGQGTLPRPRIRIANIAGTITSLLLSLPRGLEGAKVTRLRTLARFLDEANFLPYVDSGYVATGYVSASPDADPSATWPPEVYYVDRKAIETRDVVEFELASAFDLVGVRIPARQCLTRCQWAYRSPECGYTGTSYWTAEDQQVFDPALDACGKRIDSCKLRFGDNNELPYGGFPGIGTFFT